MQFVVDTVMAPNQNLHKTIFKKNMENAIKKDRRVKRLQGQVADRKGIKISAYTASLVLEENISVDAATRMICEHLSETKKQKRSLRDQVSPPSLFFCLRGKSTRKHDLQNQDQQKDQQNPWMLLRSLIW